MEPTVTYIDVIADNEQGEAMIGNLVDNQGVEDFVIFLYRTFRWACPRYLNAWMS